MADTNRETANGSEAALRHALSLLTATLEATTDAIVALDHDDRLVAFNSRLQEMWSIPDDVIASRDGRRAMAGALSIVADPDEFVRVIEQAKAQPDRNHLHLIRMRDGRTIERHVRPQLVDGRVIGQVVSFRDITEQEKGRRALEEKETLLRSIVDNEPECVKLLAADGSLMEMNPAGLAMIEADSKEQVLGRRMTEIVAPEHQDAFNQLGKQVFRGESGTLEFDVVGLKGTRRTLETHAVPIRDEAGAVRHLLGVTRDITERKRAQESLAASAEWYRALFEHSPMPMYVYDVATLRFVDVNEAAVTQYGFSREEFLAMTLLEIRPPDEHERLREFLAARPVAQSNAGLWKHRRKDGSVFDVEIASHLLGPSGGKRRIVLARDVSERIKAEAALRESQEQLRQAQKMDAIGRLAGGVAHDFNNILTAVLGNVSMLQEEPGIPSDALAELGEIRAAAERAASLTQQLLAFSRRQVIQPSTLDVGTVVRGMEPMLRRLLGEDVHLLVECPETVWPLVADLGQLQQVVLNLCVNGRDAMPQGGVLTVRCANAELASRESPLEFSAERGAHVMLEVVDTGTGITDEVRAHLFEPFFTTKQGGTGLGLSTVYGIVRQARGFVRVDSEPGKGSAFRVFLPAAPVPAPAPATPDQRALGGVEVVMIVEDDDAVRKLARRTLEARGYTVLEAGGGEDALRSAAAFEGTIHLLLTDVVMPGMSGREVADAFTALRPGIKVIFMSGYTDDAVLKHGVMHAQQRFLEKPFGPDDLARKVRDSLDER